MGLSVGWCTMVPTINKFRICKWRDGLVSANASKIFWVSHQTVMNKHISLSLKIIFDTEKGYGIRVYAISEHKSTLNENKLILMIIR